MSLSQNLQNRRRPGGLQQSTPRPSQGSGADEKVKTAGSSGDCHVPSCDGLQRRPKALLGRPAMIETICVENGTYWSCVVAAAIADSGAVAVLAGPATGEVEVATATSGNC